MMRSGVFDLELILCFESYRLYNNLWIYIYYINSKNFNYNLTVK